MATQSLADSRHTVPEEVHARVLRGLKLFEERGHEIERVWSDLYLVPSCTGERTYRVRYGRDQESCDCHDFEFHGENCKHIYCVAISRAKRRGAAR